MSHSMDLSDNEFHILERIAFSPEPMSAYVLARVCEKNYKTIHTVCKRLVSGGFIESLNETNEKNAPKRIFQLTLYGFCKFFAQSAYGENGSGIEKKSDLKKILENWKHLHESISWFQSFPPDLKQQYVYEFFVSCRQIIEDTRWDEGEWFRRMSVSPLGVICIETKRKSEIDNEFFKILFHNIFSSIDTDKMISLIKESKRGRPVIKQYLADELSRYERLRRIDNLL